jgi:hypothetical protein
VKAESMSIETMNDTEVYIAFCGFERHSLVAVFNLSNIIAVVWEDVIDNE